MELDNQMKALLKDLGMALHHALTDDNKIKDITDRIKGSGYDIYLIMEANIALDRRDDDENGRLFYHKPEDQMELEQMKFNNFDADFLTGLKIKIDD